MYPYHINVSNETGLYLLKDGRYQTTQKGEISPIMIGFGYILVDNRIAKYFQSLEVERVTFKPAIIWVRSSDIEHSNYKEMVVNHHFDSSQINDINIDGLQFLLMHNQFLFASPDLKSELESSGIALQFSEGLSEFA